MKRIVILCLILLGCNKEKQEMVWLTVKDKITNEPVKGATFQVFKCVPNIDPFCGLIAWLSAQTGDDGRCSFTKADFDKVTFTQAYRSDYWMTSTDKGSIVGSAVGIYPCGWIRLRITRGASCPPGSQLEFFVSGLQGTSSTSFTRYHAAADSNIVLKCFGGQTNRISWSLKDPAYLELRSGAWDQQVPRLDSINATLNY